MANNMANSCWDAHDIILKDASVKTACAVIQNPNTPDFVTSAAVGFLCSISYRPASRKAMLEQVDSMPSLCARVVVPSVLSKGDGVPPLAPGRAWFRRWSKSSSRTRPRSTQ